MVSPNETKLRIAIRGAADELDKINRTTMPCGARIRRTKAVVDLLRVVLITTEEDPHADQAVQPG